MLMNEAKMTITNRLSRTPTIPTAMETTFSTRYSAWSSYFNDVVVSLFKTSLGSDVFSITFESYMYSSRRIQWSNTRSCMSVAAAKGSRVPAATD